MLGMGPTRRMRARSCSMALERPIRPIDSAAARTDAGRAFDSGCTASPLIDEEISSALPVIAQKGLSTTRKTTTARTSTGISLNTRNHTWLRLLRPAAKSRIRRPQ